jgi:hypothetical protein
MTDATLPTPSTFVDDDVHPATLVNARRRRAYAGAALMFLRARHAPRAAAARELRELYGRAGLSAADVAAVEAPEGHDPTRLHELLHLVAEAGLGPALVRDLVRLGWADSHYHPRERLRVRTYATLLRLDDAMVECIERELFPEEPEEEPEPPRSWLGRLMGINRR